MIIYNQVVVPQKLWKNTSRSHKLNTTIHKCNKERKMGSGGGGGVWCRDTNISSGAKNRLKFKKTYFSQKLLSGKSFSVRTAQT